MPGNLTEIKAGDVWYYDNIIAAVGVSGQVTSNLLNSTSVKVGF